MTNNEKMLHLVLSDQKLIEMYEFNPDDYDSIDDALKSENPIIVAIANIIQGISNMPNKSNLKDTYNEVFNYLNQNLL